MIWVSRSECRIAKSSVWKARCLHFIRPVRLQVAEDDEDGFVEESLAVEPQPERPENHNFMPRALQVPGACHAIHNACLNLDDALSEFDWFFTSLKKLDALIGNKRRRERFVQVVLTGTPLYEAGQKVLESFRSTLHKERWGELAGYLSDGLPILIFLRQHWDPVAYSRGLQEDAVEGDEFSCRGITELLKDEYFCAYWHTQLQLRDVVRSLLRWVEGCSCHSNFVVRRASSQAANSAAARNLLPQRSSMPLPSHGV